MAPIREMLGSNLSVGSLEFVSMVPYSDKGNAEVDFEVIAGLSGCPMCAGHNNDISPPLKNIYIDLILKVLHRMLSLRFPD